MGEIKTTDLRRYLRAKNMKNLLDILLKKDEIARVELSEITGLTKTTVSSMVHELIYKGVLEETRPILNKNGVGRTITPLRIREDAAYAVGIELSRHHINAVLINSHGEIILRKTGPSYGDVGPKKVISTLFEFVDDIFKSLSGNKRIDTIGIGAPGSIEVKGGVIVEPPNFFGWKNVPLGKIMFEKYNVPIWIENDANCAALAEKWYGKGKNLNTFLYVLLNDGIGAGIIINERVYKGASNYEGELGHTLVRDGSKVHFLEDVCGVESLLETISIHANNEKNRGDLSKVNDEVVKNAGHLIGESFATVANMLAPEKIFIGGKITTLGNRILSSIREAFNEYSLGEKWGKAICIDFSDMYEDAISMGAATYAMRHFVFEKAINAREPYSKEGLK